MAEQKTLSVSIAGNVFKIKIDAEDEQTLVEVLKNVNVKIKDFNLNYPGLHLQDYLSMAIIWIASEKLSQFKKDEAIEAEQQKELDFVNNKLNKWIKILDNNEE